ncbi:hypothetical protein BDR07DRAFT_1545945 [Suillus spraguei]|nr:hypothetical protein BDR07DRAFT_1545945 [Suillus spraguei]
MTVVSNSPSWWPTISSNILFSYWKVAAGVVVLYDCVLTLEQEIELIWVRYIGLLYVVSLVISINVLKSMPLVSLTDAECNILGSTMNEIMMIVPAMLGVLVAILIKHIAAGGRPASALNFWVLNTVWEVLALCLSVWIAVKHFRDLRRFSQSTGTTSGDCFTANKISRALFCKNPTSAGARTLYGVFSNFIERADVCAGPRLILSIREYYAKRVANSDSETITITNSIVFQERLPAVGYDACVAAATAAKLTKQDGVGGAEQRMKNIEHAVGRLSKDGKIINSRTDEFQTTSGATLDSLVHG